MIASEAAPWAKIGGLGDVVAALPAVLDDLGHDVTVVVPRYRNIDTTGAEVRTGRLRHGAHERAVAWHVVTASPRRRLVFVDSPDLYDRPGIYGEGEVDYADNAVRFDFLSLAALEFARAEDRGVHIVHAHDWQASTALARLATDPAWGALGQAGRVLTIHNLAYHGAFPRDVVPALGLSWDVFHPAVGEFWGQFCFLKAAINTADAVTTVSPRYAKETLTESFGHGLDGELRACGDRYVGILNGIDTDLWNPATDPHLPAHFDGDNLAGKAACKRALLGACGLRQGDDALVRPLVGMVSRLVAQKGLDLIESAGADLAALDAAFIFVGAGEPAYERALRALATAHPSRVATRIGFDEPLAHLVEAGADMFLMPSAFEPCGLNQLYSLRYGTVPIVRAVGGLDDSIQPYTARARHATGFKFREGSPQALLRAIRQAVGLYHNPPAWRKLIHNGMTADHSWRAPAREYGKVYRRARAAGLTRGQRGTGLETKG